MGLFGDEQDVIRRLVLSAGALHEGKQVLSRDQAHYLRRVLRLKIDDELLLSDGAGKSARGRVLFGDGLMISDIQTAAEPIGPSLTLIQGLAKGEKMDLIIRQATELGVRRIQPVRTARAVASREDRIERWRSIAEDALRVSGRSIRPVIEPVIDLAELWQQDRQAQSFCLSLDADRLLPNKVSAAEILIGPEGGLNDDENNAAENNGFVQVGLGPHTLRTQTAGPAALAVLMYGSGGFG